MSRITFNFFVPCGQRPRSLALRIGPGGREYIDGRPVGSWN